MTDTKCNCQMAACTCGPPYEDEQRYVVGYSGQGDTEVVYGDQGIEDVLTYAAEQAVLECQQHILDGFVWGAHEDSEYEQSLAQYDIDTTDTHRERLVKELLGSLRAQAYRPLDVGNVAIVKVDTTYTREAGESYVITIRKEDA